MYWLGFLVMWVILAVVYQLITPPTLFLILLP